MNLPLWIIMVLMNILDHTWMVFVNSKVLVEVAERLGGGQRDQKVGVLLPSSQDTNPAISTYNRWNEHFADSVLGQHLWLCRKFSALHRSTISSPPKKGVQSPKAFICFNSNWMNPMCGYSHREYVLKES